MSSYSLNDSHIKVLLLSGDSLKDGPKIFYLGVGVLVFHLCHFELDFLVDPAVPVRSLWTWERLTWLMTVPVQCSVWDRGDVASGSYGLLTVTCVTDEPLLAVSDTSTNEENKISVSP